MPAWPQRLVQAAGTSKFVEDFLFLELAITRTCLAILLCLGADKSGKTVRLNND